MVTTIRLYVDAVFAIANMAVLGIISGFAAGAITGDKGAVVIAAAAVFLLTGAVFIFRLWRMTKKPMPPLDSAI